MTYKRLLFAGLSALPRAEYNSIKISFGHHFAKLLDLWKQDWMPLISLLKTAVIVVILLSFLFLW